MTTEELKKELEGLAVRFNNASRSGDEERATKVLKKAIQIGNYDPANASSPTCPKCKNKPFYAPYSKALCEGHVYSDMGIVEIRISGYCEFCFDEITKEPDDE